MAMEIKSAPVLEGQAARDFYKRWAKCTERKSKEEVQESMRRTKAILDKGIFQALKDEKMFNTVTPFIGTIQWENLADLCPDTVYLDSVKIVNKTARDN